jgi:outer membrane protein
MKKVQYICLLFLLLASHVLVAQEKWSLRKSVDYALANNISIKQQDVQARLQRLTYEQSKLALYPTLNFGNSIGLNTGRSIDRTTNLYTTQSIFFTGFSLQTNVDVFNFGSKRRTLEANRYASQAALASIEKLKDDVALNVAGAYLQALLNKQQIEISKIQVQQSSAQLSNTRKLVQAGSLPELNAAQLESQLAQDSANLITAIGNEAKALLGLKALLNLDAGVTFDIEAPPVELIPIEPLASLQPEAVYALALKNLPQQRVNDLLLLSAIRNVDAAKGAMYPSVSFSGSIQTNYSNAKNNPRLLGTSVNGFNPIGIVKGSLDTVIAPNIVPSYRFYAAPFGAQFTDNTSNGIGLNISVPIFNGGAARTGWKRAKLNVETYELQKQQDNLTLKQDIYSAYTDATTSLQTFNAATKTVEATQKAFDFGQKRYDAGLLNTIDLITTQNNLFNARLQRLLAQFDYVFKMKVLEFYKGQGLKL